MCDKMIVQDFTVNDEKQYKCWIYAFEKYLTRPTTDPNAQEVDPDAETPAENENAGPPTPE